MEFQKGDKVKVVDSSYSYYIGEDGLKNTACLQSMGEHEVIQTDCKMPMWYRVFGKKLDSCYDKTPDNDTLIKQLSTGKIISIQERFLQKVEAPKPEPKFKSGDKVVPIGISWTNWTFKEYLNYPSRIPAFLREKGYLCVKKFENGLYHCGTDNMQGKDRFKESELILYVEPKEVKPEPPQYRKSVQGEWTGGQFKVGDRVRNIKVYQLKDVCVGEIGIVISIDNNGYTSVQFDKDIGGHNGSLSNGKRGYCWCFEPEYLELVTESKALPINLCPEPKTYTESKTFTFKGNKTVCTIEIDGRKWTGVALCDPNDAWNQRIGRQYAELRANRKLLDAVEKELQKG